MAELRKKERDLQDKLAKKLEELKKICLREAVSFTLVQLFSQKYQQQLTNSESGSFKGTHRTVA